MLYCYDLQLDRVLDLNSSAMLDDVGLSRDQVVGSDWAIPQEFGEAAHAAGWQALLAPSATGVDLVLAVYLQNLGAGRLAAQAVETWGQPADI